MAASSNMGQSPGRSRFGGGREEEIQLADFGGRRPTDLARAWRWRSAGARRPPPVLGHALAVGHAAQFQLVAESARPAPGPSFTASSTFRTGWPAVRPLVLKAVSTSSSVSPWQLALSTSRRCTRADPARPAVSRLRGRARHAGGVDQHHLLAASRPSRSAGRGHAPGCATTPSMRP